jgi:hypothetical protein
MKFFFADFHKVFINGAAFQKIIASVCRSACIIYFAIKKPDQDQDPAVYPSYNILDPKHGTFAKIRFKAA